MLSSKTERIFHRCLLVPAVLLAMGPSALAGALLGNGEYFVLGTGSDARGDGSEGNPWRTITHAVDQAGGGQPVIFVGPGTYDVAAGEQFPIQLDEDDDLGAILVGTGDYGADAAIIDISTHYAAFTAYGLDSGTVVVTGFVGRGDSSGVLLSCSEMDFCVIAANELSGIGLLDAHMHEPGEYIVAGNTVQGCDVGVEFYAHSTGGEGGIDLLVIDNQFLNMGEGVYVEPYQASDTVSLHLEVLNNLFVDCSTGVWVDSSMSETGVGYVNVKVRGNDFEDCGYGLWFSHDAYYHAQAQRLITVQNNTIDASYTAIGFSTSLSTGCVLHQGITVHGNQLRSTDGCGIYQSLELEYESAQVDQEMYIAGNVIEDCYYEGVYLFVSASYTDDMVVNDVVIEGNTIRGGESQGIDISEYYSYTAYVDANYVIRHNLIEDNDGGIDLSYTQYTLGSANITYDVRGNCLANDAPNLAIHWNVADTSVAANVALEAGTWGLMGYNTIGQPSNPTAGGSSTVWVTGYTTSGTNVLTADLIGNWWGTLDSSEIQARIYDGNDASGLIVANAGNPLDDNLDFTVAKIAGELRLNAGPNAGFVSYVGRVSPGGPGASQVPFGFNRIKVLVNGELQDPDGVIVADDYRSLTFPMPPGSFGEGTICVVNPCGQMGCTDYEFCDGNMIPTANFDDVETELDTAVLIDLLANDTDPENGLDPTTLVITQMPEHGTLVLNPNGDNPGEVLYTPEAGWNSCDSFNYTVSDTCGDVSNVGTAQVCIVNAPPPNHAPKANYDSADTDPLLAVTIDVLANDSDVDGDDLDPASVQIEWAGSKGMAVVNLDGTVTYTPYAGTEATTDTFNYSMADIHGARSNTATVEIRISGGNGKVGG